MERQKEQEIRDYLKKVGLDCARISQEGSEFMVVSTFKTGAYIKGNFKKNLVSSLEDLINLTRAYIQNINEN